MAIELEIRKKAGNVWEYIKTDVTPNIKLTSSKQHLRTTDTDVEFTEPYSNDFVRTGLDKIAVYDDTASSTEETFTDISVFAARLKTLGNPAFYRASDVVIADLVSSDLGNIIIIGTDGGLYVSGDIDGGSA